MRQLLREYPLEKISWWSCRPEPPGQASFLPVKHFRFSAPVRLYPYFRFGRLKSRLLELMWLRAARAHLRRCINDVGPEQLWFNLHSWAIPVAAGLAPEKEIPTHVSLWDYPDVEIRQTLLGKRRTARWLAAVESLIKTATSFDLVSEPMREDIARRTGRCDGIVVHSGFEHSDRDALGDETQPDFIRIAYAGSVLARDSMECFINAYKSALPRLKSPARLEFFGGAGFRNCKWFDPACMLEHPHLEENEFRSQLRGCTWGLVVMDLTDKTQRYNRFSFPNKFGTLVAAGLPIIAVGHEQSSVARLMREHPVGVCTNAATVQELTTFLEAALCRTDPRGEFREQLRRCATTEFNMPAMRERLWNALGVVPTTVNERDG